MIQLMKRTLLQGLSELQQVIDRLLKPSEMKHENWFPTLDIKEEPDQYIIHADTPGVNPKNLSVTMSKGTLVIKGHFESESKKENENYLRRERLRGRFYREINLPHMAESEKIHARIKSGVLVIIVPKDKDTASHQIQIHEE